MLPLHTNSLAGRLRSFTWSSFFCWLLFVNIGCSNASAGRGGFYSYVDAQGNAVTVSAPANVAEDNKSDDTDKHAQTSVDVEGDEEAASEVNNTLSDVAAKPPEISYASSPDELWAQDDEGYVTSDDFEREAKRKQQERFVSYPDEAGRLVTREVDMLAAKQASEVRKEVAHDQGEDVLPDVGAVTSWTTINSDCCQSVLVAAAALTDGDEKTVNVMTRPRGSIVVDQQHPATAFRLDSSLQFLQLQSWKKKGYLYPQALFLDANGIPMSRVAQIFTRKKEQTWAAQPYLIGEIPIEPGATWLVLFLDYAQVEGSGKISQNQDYLMFDDFEVPLVLRGELVIRATNGVF